MQIQHFRRIIKIFFTRRSRQTHEAQHSTAQHSTAQHSTAKLKSFFRLAASGVFFLSSLFAQQAWAVPDIEVYSPDNTLIPSGGSYSDFDGHINISTGSRAYTIRNSGDTKLTLDVRSVVLSGPDADQFTILEQPDRVISAGGSARFVIERAIVSNAKTYTTTVSIASDDPDEDPYSFTITAEVGEPEIEITGGTNGLSIPNDGSTPEVANGTDFGSVDTSAAGVAHTFTVHNRGTGDLRPFPDRSPEAYIIGIDAAQFRLSRGFSSGPGSFSSGISGGAAIPSRSSMIPIRQGLIQHGCFYIVMLLVNPSIFSIYRAQGRVRTMLTSGPLKWSRSAAKRQRTIPPMPTR